MKNTIKEIINSREDLSNYLFHFTKGGDAKNTLMTIVKDGIIKDINNTGCLCFADAPVTMLAPMFEIFKRYKSPLYAPYGIGIKKDYIYQLGGRPVIYGDDKENRTLPQNLRWRYEYYHPQVHDFTWLREWRVQKSSVELSFDNCFIIVDTNQDIEEMWYLTNTIDVDIDAQPEDGGFQTEYSVYLSKKYRMVSMEDIATICLMDKKELMKELSKQPREEFFSASVWE